MVEPADPLNWSIEEFTSTPSLEGNTFRRRGPRAAASVAKDLSDKCDQSSRNNDVVVVPTNSLFIAALPDSHSLLQQFTLYHRMVDLMRAEAEQRGKELENLRRTAIIPSGEREDPNIDHHVFIQGTVCGVVVTG